MAIAAQQSDVSAYTKHAYKKTALEDGLIQNIRKQTVPTRDEATREWRRLHYEELYDLHTYSNIIRVTKSRRMRWAGHVTREGKKRGTVRILVGELEVKK